MAVAFAFVIPGCTDPISASADYLEVFEGYVDVGDPPTSPGELTGPHFDLKIAEVATTAVLKGSPADNLDLDEPLQAAADHEFVLAKLRSNFEPPRWERKDANVEVAVVVADQRRPLAGVVDRLSAYTDLALVVSVPEGAPVTLEVTDEGRPLSLDLRTGSLAGNSTYQVLYSEELTRLDYEETGTVEAFGRTRLLKVEIVGLWSSTDSHSLEPFVPSAGWAEPGRSWLLIPGLRTSSSIPYDPNLFGFDMAFDLDTAATFGLAQPGGTITRAEAWQPFGVDDLETNGILGFNVIFDVPDSFRTGTLQITLDGPMTARLDGSSVPTGWATPPPPAQLPIVFSP